MATALDSPDRPLPLIPPPAPINSYVGARATTASSRIDGYDLARALAVIGMTVVNYDSIFWTYSKAPLHFSGLAEFLSGRAAVLFVMLAGVGMTLLARRPLLAGTPEAMSVFRIRVVRRCLVLLVMGFSFRLTWNADILHFYALFLSLAVLFVSRSNSVLWLAAGAFWFVGASAFSLSMGDPDLGELLNQPLVIFDEIGDILFSGNYALFPWFSFILVGIWFGRPEVMNRPERHGRIFLIAMIVFTASETLMLKHPLILQHPSLAESPLSSFIIYNSFPASPFFALSAGACAMMVLITSLYIARLHLLNPLVQNLKYMGKLSLTIYLGHILIGQAVYGLFTSEFGWTGYPLAVTSFMALIMVLQCGFAVLWCRSYDRGPLEMLLRRLSGTS